MQEIEHKTLDTDNEVDYRGSVTNKFYVIVLILALKREKCMKSSKSNGSNSIGKIDKVDSSLAFHKATGNKWMSIFKVFNPLGHVAELYTQTLAYKIESKRLDIELTRIIKQTEIVEKIIDSTFELKMEDLRQRREGLLAFYNTVSQQLERLHIERMEVLKMVQLATKRTLDTDISFEERKLFKEFTIELTSQLPLFGDQANESLRTLVKALPPVEIPRALLENNSSPTYIEN
jgi:hypothetical protein